MTPQRQRRLDRTIFIVLLSIVVFALGWITANPIPESCKDSYGYVSEC